MSEFFRCVQLDEFFDFLKEQANEATARIADILEMNMMVQPTRKDIQYVPPKSGILYMVVGDSYQSRGNC